MHTKGKYYLKLNIASSEPYFWDANSQNFTNDAYKATFYNDKQEAQAEAQHAEYNNQGEVLVQQATKDLA